MKKTSFLLFAETTVYRGRRVLLPETIKNIPSRVLRVTLSLNKKHANNNVNNGAVDSKADTIVASEYFNT
jgi:hypothetical protein